MESDHGFRRPIYYGSTDPDHDIKLCILLSHLTCKALCASFGRFTPRWNVAAAAPPPPNSNHLCIQETWRNRLFMLSAKFFKCRTQTWIVAQHLRAYYIAICFWTQNNFTNFTFLFLISPRSDASAGISVADPDPNPDPDLPDPHVFGPPGSGSWSISHKYGSGSCSWSGSFDHEVKIVRKTLILLFCDFFLTFYLWKML